MYNGYVRNNPKTEGIFLLFIIVILLTSLAARLEHKSRPLTPEIQTTTSVASE